MAARKRPDSNLQQFLNAFGIEMDELQEEAQALWNSIFISTLDPDVPAWLQKAAYPGGEVTVRGLHQGIWVELEPVERLRDFMRSQEHVYIIDKEHRVIYFRQRYDAMHINNESVTLQDHHVWNSFDEFAFRAGLRRHRLESNEELRQRTLYAFRYPYGVAAPLANFAGLLAQKEWPKEAPFITLDEKHVLKDTVRINDKPALPGQVTEDNRLVPQVLPLATEGHRDKTVFLHGVLSLEDGALEGSFISALLDPGNLGQWSHLEIEGDFLPHQISVDLLPAFFEPGGGVKPILSGLKATQSLQTDPEGPSLAQPVFVRVTLRRKRNEVSPKVSLLRLTYTPQDRSVDGEPDRPSLVQYLYGVVIEELHDPEVKARLMQELEDARRDGGRPYLLQLIDELATAIPVLWDQFIWDEAYWDIYETSLVGLDTLDSPWHTTLEGIRQLQPGIGFGDDLLTTHKNWHIVSQPGVYFSGPNLEAHYLFANPLRTVVVNPSGPIHIPAGPPGTPAVIKAFRGQEELYLSQVCFLDDSFTPTITNTEVLTGLGRPYVSATYGQLDIQSVVVEGYTVDVNAYDGTDRIPLTQVVPEGESVTVHYRLKDSFALRADADEWVVEVSGQYDRIEIVTENGEERIHALSLDPVATHLRTGFVYIDAAHVDYPPASLRLRATPSAVLGDGHGRVLITVDVLDRWGNPVYVEYGQEPMVSVIGSGSVEFIESHANRFHYQYTSAVVDKDEQVIIQATLGNLEASAVVMVKEVSVD